MTDLRARLRAVPTLTGSPPPFDPEATRSRTLRADEVEFWQADPDRRHLRLGYERTASDEWTKELLWP